MKILLRFISILAFTLFITSSVWAQFQGAVWDTLTNDTARDQLSRHPLAASHNMLHLVYSRFSADLDNFQIYYRELGGMGWSDPAAILPDSFGLNPTIAAYRYSTNPDLQDSLLAAIFFNRGGDIYGAVKRDTTAMGWQVFNLTNTPDRDVNPYAVFDPMGNIHLTWVTTQGGEPYIAHGMIAAFDTTMQLMPEVIEQAEVVGPDSVFPVIVEVDTVPHIFYRGRVSDTYRIQHVYRVRPDTAWTVETLFTDNAQDLDVAARLDMQNDIHLAISGINAEGLSSRVYYVQFSNQNKQWSSPQLASGTFSAHNANLDFGQNGTIYIVSTGVLADTGTGEVLLSENSTGEFLTQVLGYFPRADRPAIAFADNDRPGIVAQARIGGNTLSNTEIIFYGPALIGVNDNIILPENPMLVSNYPNPFNAKTIITVQGVADDRKELSIYDITGRKIKSLAPLDGDQWQYRYLWDGSTQSGQECPSGIYFYKVNSASNRLMGKMTLMK